MEGRQYSVSNFAEVAEQEVIGAVLLDQTSLAIARDIVKPSDFFGVANQCIYNAMCELEDQGQPINVASLFAKLSSNSSFNERGGIQYLMNCQQYLPSACNVVSHANIIRTDSIRRRIAKFADKLRVVSAKPIDDADLTVSQLGDELLSLSNISNIQPWMDFSSALKETVNDLSKAEEGSITTGFTDLDSKMTGLKPGTLTIVAARPAMGKTAFGLNILAHVALKLNVPVAFFSLEMTTIELVYRVLSSLSNVNGNAIRQKRMAEEEWGRLLDCVREYTSAKIYIDETPGLDISILRERARRLQRQYGIGLIIVDYLQLMHANDKKILNREQEVSTISKGLKGIAKELHIPVVALAQLNRALDARSDKHPILSDLRESGSIEQDSDNILFIHREDYYRNDEEKDNTAEIIIAKQRSGPTGIIKLHWAGEYTRFSNLESTNGDKP